MISIAPRDVVLSQAEELDTERHNGKLRSALHGIQIIVKDAIITSKELGMPTTAGAFAFKETYGKRNAAIVETTDTRRSDYFRKSQPDGILWPQSNLHYSWMVRREWPYAVSLYSR